MCSSGRRRRGQDVPAHLVHNEQVSVRVRADRVRQLRGDSDDRRRAVHPRLVRHGRPRGLRPSAALVLPADGRLSRLLQLRESELVRERQGEVGARDTAPLPEDALSARRHADRFARGLVHRGQAGQEQAQARLVRAGREAGQGAQGRQVCRVLGSYSERTEKRVRRGHRGRPHTARSQKEEAL